ncbi:class I SAM-dependent methyltransferase [Cyanobacteria bacterium FACHB-DQ100]|uniref:class I SAM-dependent methyltransferase n=1 Tax=Leptolyngbya sp. DQ-M1 TaxID=2933920 RepID=UPI0019B10676|nr:class I SAM-dependent methyltransferase [Cyanobacteria bacterium FACHB-DQ100]
MTATRETKPSLTSRIVNGILSIPPVFNLARVRARNMMMKRAESIGVPWTKIVADLQARDWSKEFERVNNPELKYPEYYLRPFHAYEAGNLGWEPATEVEVAAYAVHARIWQDAGKDGDRRLRQSYHDVLKAEISTAPKDIIDFGCSVGMSTVALQETFPGSTVTGVDLSPHFLAVAEYRVGNRPDVHWRHAAAESTDLPAGSYDLVSACLLFHELPQDAAIAILQEARRLLRPGGHLAIMDMNPRSEVYAKMPPYILTLLKSTEPYLDQYFALDLEGAIVQAGFAQPSLTCNSPRHRTLIAQAC